MEAGRAQVLTVGVDELSLREVARSLGVTAAALYAHIDGKPGLVAAIAADYFEGLSVRFEQIEMADPLARIRAQCRAYVEHALESPRLYEVMMRFPPALPVLPDDETSSDSEVQAFDPATQVFSDALGAAAEAAEKGLLRLEDPLMCAFTLWSGVHGVVETLTMGFQFTKEVSDQLIDSMIETLIRGLSADR